MKKKENNLIFFSLFHVCLMFTKGLLKNDHGRILKMIMKKILAMKKSLNNDHKKDNSNDHEKYPKNYTKNVCSS